MSRFIEQSIRANLDPYNEDYGDEDSHWTLGECVDSYIQLLIDCGADLDDQTALRCGFNDYTDGLCKDGIISGGMYSTMDNPF